MTGSERCGRYRYESNISAPPPLLSDPCLWGTNKNNMSDNADTPLSLEDIWIFKEEGTGKWS